MEITDRRMSTLSKLVPNMSYSLVIVFQTFKRSNGQITDLIIDLLCIIQTREQQQRAGDFASCCCLALGSLLHSPEGKVSTSI